MSFLFLRSWISESSAGVNYPSAMTNRGRPLTFSVLPPPPVFARPPLFRNLVIQSESLARHNFRRAPSLLECDEIKWSKCVLVPTRASSRTAATASCSFIPLHCYRALSPPRFSTLATPKDFAETPLLCVASVALPYNVHTYACTYACM